MSIKTKSKARNCFEATSDSDRTLRRKLEDILAQQMDVHAHYSEE